MADLSKTGHWEGEPTRMISGSNSVEDKARRALLTSPVNALHELKVNQTEDALQISGTVGSYYHKQLAQEAVRHVAQDLQVVNTIYVDYPHVVSER